MNASSFSLAAAGPKGADFLALLLSQKRSPRNVFSYAQKGETSLSFERIMALCNEFGVALHRTGEPQPQEDELFFFVGWQMMYRGYNPRLVVFHDSLLPKYRGFAPTVAALIAGEAEIGVTALAPAESADAGVIYGQKSIPIHYPTKIADALRLQTCLMADLAIELLDLFANGGLPRPAHQDESQATYSIWRDEQDYWIDFSQDASEVVRFIHAVGEPYLGASSRVGEEILHIYDAETVEDLRFVQRSPGKVWRLDRSGPVVVCGRGMIRLTDICKADGSKFKINKLRTRFQSR